MSLTRDQVVDLLTAAACYDNRKPNPATLLAWTEAATRGRWTFEAALAAVHDHYLHSTEFVMPGHVMARVVADRAQPPLVRAALPVDVAADAEPASPEHVASCLAELSRSLGWRVEEVDRRAVLAIRCEFCGASIGEPCTRPSDRAGQRVRTGFHPSRVAAATHAEATG